MAILQNAGISLATSGDQTAISAVSGRQIKVWRVVIANGVATAQTIVVKDDTAGGTLATLPLPSSIGGGYALGNGDLSQAPVFRSISGGTFCLNLSASTQVSGFVQYTIE